MTGRAEAQALVAQPASDKEREDDAGSRGSKDDSGVRRGHHHAASRLLLPAVVRDFLGRKGGRGSWQSSAVDVRAVSRRGR